MVISTRARKKKTRRKALKKRPDGKFVYKNPEGDAYYEVVKYMDFYSELNESTIGKVQI